MTGLLSVTKTNFTAGELDPAMLGRGDLTAFANGAWRLRNVIIAPTGGVSRRPGLRHVDQAPGEGRLIAFEFNTEQVYLIVLTAGLLDIYSGDTRIGRLGTPWTLAQIRQLAWSQSADTLLLVHPDISPRKLTRTGADSWSLSEWSFYQDDNTGKVYCPYHKFADDAVSLTPSATGGTLTLSASSGIFQAGHVGRHMRINAKQVMITAVASATSATAHAFETLTSTSATTDWEEEAFSSLHGWPATVCFHQGRLVIGGSRDLPNRLWLSKSMDLFNFDLGTGLDDDGIEFAMLSDQVNAIRGVFSGRHLQVFTSGAEYMVSGSPLTPSKIQVDRQTRIGSPTDRMVPPRDVDGATHFISRNGRDLRQFLYTDVEQLYQSVDLAMLAKHVMAAPVDQDYDGSRRLFHVVMGDGTLGTLTIYRTEKVTAWSVQETDGAFLSVAALEGTVYVLVRRGTAIFIERFDDTLNLDCALSETKSDATTAWSGLDHLEGRKLRVLGDGGAIADVTVTGGWIALPTAAATIQAGLPFAHEIAPLPSVGGSGGTLPMGQSVRLVQAGFRLLDTQALSLDTGQGLKPIPLRRFGRDSMGTAPKAFTGDIRLRAIGWRRDNTRPLWRIYQDTPLACTVLSVTTQIKTGD